MRDHDERWVLDHLVSLCRDEARELRFAAEHVTDPRVRALLGGLSEERGRFAHDLLPHARRVGGGGHAAGESWSGTLRRRWLEARDRWLGLSDRDLLVSAARDERRTLASFEEALASLLSPSTRDLLEAQQDAVQQSSARVRDLLAL